MREWTLKTAVRLLILPVALAGLPVLAEEEGAAADEVSGPELDAETVARVDGENVPYEWFLHEFRSSFFRYDQEGDARRQAFEQFLDRAVLYEAARNAGIDEQPALRAAIHQRVDGMRAFMEYQIAMTERQMVIERFLAEKGLDAESLEVTDEDLRAYFEQEFAGKATTTATFDELPPYVLEQLRERVRAIRQQEAMEALASELRAEMSIAVNEELVENVPLPRIVGQPPFAPPGTGAPPPPPPPPPAP